MHAATPCQVKEIIDVFLGTAVGFLPVEKKTKQAV